MSRVPSKRRGVASTIAKVKPDPNSNIGRPISLSGPLDEIEDRMSNPVGNTYIVSCHGCRTGRSFDVGKNISVVTTSRHQYKASGPTVVKVKDAFGPSLVDTYSVIEPTMAIGQNIIATNNPTIGGVVESIRNTIVPEDEQHATKNHAFAKRTRAVIKMRDSDSQPMTIPESRLFVAGKKISGYEGVFIVKPGVVVRDVTAEFGLTEREDKDRESSLLRQTPHPQVDIFTRLITGLIHQLARYTLTNPGAVDQIKIKENDIKMLETEMENRSVLGKYFLSELGGTHVDRDVLFSDIANHPKIQDGDVIILYVCNDECDKRTGFRHGEPTADRNAKLGVLGRTLSGITGEDNVLKGIIYRDDTPHSDGEMGGGNSNLKTKTKRNIKRKKYKRLSVTTVKRRALRRKLRRSRNRSYRKSYRI